MAKLRLHPQAPKLTALAATAALLLAAAAPAQATPVTTDLGSATLTFDAATSSAGYAAFRNYDSNTGFSNYVGSYNIPTSGFQTSTSGNTWTVTLPSSDISSFSAYNVGENLTSLNLQLQAKVPGVVYQVTVGTYLQGADMPAARAGTVSGTLTMASSTWAPEPGFNNFSVPTTGISGGQHNTFSALFSGDQLSNLKLDYVLYGPYVVGGNLPSYQFGVEYISIQAMPAAVPEPATGAMWALALGLMGVTLVSRKRRD